jgi:ribulose kinase
MLGSATGQLLKHVLDTHPASNQALADAKSAGVNVFESFSSLLVVTGFRTGLRRRRSAVLDRPHNARLSRLADLARHFFFYGDLFGNRSPLADSKMRGSLIGL